MEASPHGLLTRDLSQAPHMQKILGWIPARWHSKGVPDKNKRDPGRPTAHRPRHPVGATGGLSRPHCGEHGRSGDRGIGQGGAGGRALAASSRTGSGRLASRRKRDLRPRATQSRTQLLARCRDAAAGNLTVSQSGNDSRGPKHVRRGRGRKRGLGNACPRASRLVPAHSERRQPGSVFAGRVRRPCGVRSSFPRIISPASSTWRRLTPSCRSARSTAPAPRRL